MSISDDGFATTEELLKNRLENLEQQNKILKEMNQLNEEIISSNEEIIKILKNHIKSLEFLWNKMSEKIESMPKLPFI